MPTEIRLITFVASEVIEALAAFCAATKRPLPPDGAKNLIVPNGEQTNYLIEPNGEGPAIRFYESEVAAALLAYCKKKNIPVARRSAKGLEAKGDAVVLRLTMD